MQISEDQFDSCRYSDIYCEVINKLNPKQIIDFSYEADYQGYLSADILLEDGRVVVYGYSYGSCSGCDDWEHRQLSVEEIAKEMLSEFVFYPSIIEYQQLQDRKKD